MYFTSLFPYVTLIAFGLNAWRLEGAGLGIMYYIKPDFSKLATTGVWFDAAMQTFFTTSATYGGILSFGSYNKFNQSTFKSSVLLIVLSTLTAFFAGLVVFSYIGYLATATGQNVHDVVTSGPGLTFVVFPFAVTKLAFPPFWSVMFFLMMLTLGIDTQVSI